MSRSTKSSASLVLTGIAISSAVMALCIVNPATAQAGNGAAPVEIVNTEPIPVVSQGTTSVQIENSASSPLLTRDVGGPQQPSVKTVQIHVSDWRDTSSASIKVFDVPANNRLVLEHVSCFTAVYSSFESFFASIEIRDPTGPSGFFQIPLTYFGKRTLFPGDDHEADYFLFLVNQPLKAYASAGTSVHATFVSLNQPTSESDHSCTLSGHYVSVP